MQLWSKLLGLAVLGSVVGGVALAGEPCPKPTNVNVIHNSGNYKSNTLIVERGPDGRTTQSVFIPGDAPRPVQAVQPQALQQPLLQQPQQPQTMELFPAVPAVPAVPTPPESLPLPPADPQPREPVDPQQPTPPQPVDPHPVQPVQPVPMQPVPVQPVPEIVIRIPVPAIQMPNIQMPNIRMPNIQVPAGRTMIFDGPTGRTITNFGNGGNVTIIGDQAGTTVYGGAGLCYKGKDNRFWTKTMYSPQVGATVYYDPRTTLWFKYCGKTDTFRLAPEVDLDD